MFSKFKALVPSSICQYSAKTDNSEFSLPSMLTRVIEKFRVSFNYRFHVWGKNDNSELGIHLIGNSEVSELSKLSLWQSVVEARDVSVESNVLNC